MEKAVVISVRGMQKFENTAPDVVELVTEGKLIRAGSTYTVTYEESEVTGMEGAVTTIIVEGEQVTMMRLGEFSTQMVFQEGRRHLSMYSTPYGTMEIAVDTRHLLAEMDDRGGDIEVDYAIEVDHVMTGRNIFKISIKEANSQSLKQ